VSLYLCVQVCLEPFAQGDVLVTSTECKNCFHQHCLHRWDKDGHAVAHNRFLTFRLEDTCLVRVLY
jgi:hypothetical protein